MTSGSGSSPRQRSVQASNATMPRTRRRAGSASPRAAAPRERNNEVWSTRLSRSRASRSSTRGRTKGGGAAPPPRERGERVVDGGEAPGIVALPPQPQLGAHTRQPVGAVRPAERPEGLRCECDGLVLVVVEEGQQGLGEPGQVP